MDDPAKIKAPDDLKLGRKADRPYWVMILSVLVRSVHQIGAGVFISSFLFGVPKPLPGFYTALASVTGVILLITECIRHRQYFRELIGISTIIKLVLIGMIIHAGIAVKLLAIVAFVIASVSSHLPKNIRHRLII